MIHDTVLSLIGNTPAVRINHIDTGPCELFVKLESQNPGGSIKDRIAKVMIEAAERDGKIKPGGTIIEATAGNTGLGLALVAAQKGYKMIVIVPDKMSKEKIGHLRAMGAEVVLTRSDVQKGHPEYYQDLAERILAETDNAYYINQFSNPNNPLAHETWTAKEVWEQFEGKLDACVVGVGTSGTLTGFSRFFAEAAPDMEMVIADPVGSILTEYVNTGQIKKAGSWLIEGIGEDFIPEIADLSRVKTAISVSDREAFMAARELLQKEGIFGGSSTGALFHAAVTWCRRQTEPKRVMTFCCDNGNKYLSKVYNDFWMVDQGLMERKQKFGDVRDIIGRLMTERATVTISPGEPLMSAHKRMILHEISQLPVMEEGKLVGILDESDLLLAVHNDPGAFGKSVEDFMVTDLNWVDTTASIEDLMAMFAKGHVALVRDDDGKFWGIVTKIDVINYVRRKYST
ncbi:pyridoxal-phosphate dependent enzyme [Acanthopleuribacter pedis]|uniref:Pyridoxal-phosphate dependent enzyme n=1 Tax=Acanthopleuribacter pedis TaxID=442870 RepID=A0A8J7QML6_9BACT|nr:pyridoxal-phosphate dependent enzyme [Acanthopleuribacter pedis]MBO1320770.1 pyridoxal-phosphate dependent enzyme [Acanthopleuribacter pedis]